MDTKYKSLPVTTAGNVSPDGVAQADIYQLVSYALRRGAPHTYLFYPHSLRHPASNATAIQFKYEIKDRLSGKLPSW
ncbi:5-methylcytosine restriction system specificity protein McrC [Hymenobacter nivis]|uniref:5-methylcytosine restriction system specificity protein McrC n=1 Tax=Hymenobacter nivis TaxID=1850093 RepID=UPI003977D928